MVIFTLECLPGLQEPSIGKWKTIKKKREIFFLKCSVGKFALLVIKHIANQQVSKPNDFVFKSIQLGFCQFSDTANTKMGKMWSLPLGGSLLGWYILK